MKLLGENCLGVIDTALSFGFVTHEYPYNVVMQIKEYDKPQVVDKEKIVKTQNESEVKKLEKHL
ncbi:hypothetical protein IEQ_04971 [Bacillus cereus BAG6X1-2]|nr:hypothetical protein IEQ_04971 [Bacillus cereus BAG6X1-2]